MRKLKQEKGITLVALIITIIVMMILVAVSVAIIIESDLLGTAESAGTAYRANMDKEQNMGTDTGDIKIGDDTMADYIESIGSASEVTFWLYNGNTGDYDSFTAPADATWGEIWDIVPNMSEDYSEYFLFSDEELAFGASTCFSCPNSEFGTHYITKDTLIIDAPMPHLGMLHRNDNFDVCWIEDCTNYNSSSIPAGD